MKKIGLLGLALVLALGALGVGYAAWTDQITVTGTVNTGDLDIDAVYFSGTDIYKDLDTDELVEYFWLEDAGGNLKWHSGYIPATNVLVASAAAAPGATDDTATITFTDAFPTSALVADVIIHCEGSVPAIVTADAESTDPKLNWLWDNGFITYEAAWVCIDTTAGFNYSYCAEILGPIQMHYCDYAKLWLYLDLPQQSELDAIPDCPYDQEDFMNLSGLTFTGSFDAIQWNESPVSGTGNPCDCYN